MATALKLAEPELTFDWNAACYADFWHEAAPLIARHWDEVGSHRDILDLDPDHDRYLRAEAAGYLNILTVRFGGELVGYLFLCVMPHPRDRKALVGTDETIYVAPTMRRLKLGPKMIAAAIERARLLGTNILFFRELTRRKNGGYLKRYGFTPRETVYSLVLTPPERDSR